MNNNFEIINPPSKLTPKQEKKLQNIKKWNKRFMKLQQITPLFLGFVVILIFAAYAYFSFYLETDRQSTFHICIITSAMFCIGMFEYTLYVTYREDPGFVPKNSIGLQDNEDMTYEEIKQMRENERICNICNCIKEPTTHHCGRCGRCIQVMDHHCVFIGKCVGLYNRKLFILVLFWGTVSLLHALIFSLTHIKYMAIVAYHDGETGNLYKDEIDHCGGDRSAIMTRIRHYATVWIDLYGIAFCLSLLSFLIHHLYLAIKGTTTFDQMYPSNATEIKVKKNWYTNLKDIMGNNVWEWFWPFPNPAARKISIKNISN